MDRIKNILILEDRPVWVDMIRQVISEIGNFQISCKVTENDARKKIETDEIDIAIIDLNLSDSIQKNEPEGLKLIQFIMNQNLQSKPAIIVVTGYIHLNETEFEKKYGVERLFLKSTFEKTEFKQVLEDIIKRKERG